MKTFILFSILLSATLQAQEINPVAGVATFKLQLSNSQSLSEYCSRGFDEVGRVRVEVCYETFYTGYKKLHLFSAQGGLATTLSVARMPKMGRFKKLLELVTPKCPMQLEVDRQTMKIISVTPSCDEFSEF